MDEQAQNLKRSIFWFSKDQLETTLLKYGYEKYRATQILTWIYKKRITSPALMSDLPQELRTFLQDSASFFSTRVETIFVSNDGTKKYLLRLQDNNLIEAVMIPDRNRRTVCVSTQVGCPIKCRFCASGIGGLKRNLEVDEIIEQIIHIRNGLSAQERITDIVIMGIGEPMLNLKNVIKSLKIMHEEWGLGIGYNNITLSTIGFVDKLEQLLQEGVTPNLAISLHAPDDKLRHQIVPSFKKFTVKQLIDAGLRYSRFAKKEITFEYVLINGINDRKEHAVALGEMLAGKKCKLNIIPYNQVDIFKFKSPSKEVVDQFIKTVGQMGVFVMVRRPRGVDIDAACGQLRFRHSEIA